MKTQAIAKLRYLRMAPRKVRLVANFICGLQVDKAITRLQNVKKEAQRPILKLLQSAIANAVNNLQMEKETLKIKSVLVDGGPILYRSTPRAMGRATPIRKRTSHIVLILEGETLDKKSKKEKREEDKEEIKKLKN